MVTVGGEIVFHRFDHGAEKLVGNIRHDESNGFFLAGAETPGRGIGGVSQLLNGPINLIFGLAGNIPGRVDGVGHGGSGNPRQLGHIADCHFHVRSLLRNLSSYYVIHSFFHSICHPALPVKRVCVSFLRFLVKCPYFLEIIHN